MLHFVHEHSREPVSLKKLATVAGMSRTTFTQRFKQAVRQSPNHYLVDFRLGHAKRLLAESTLTVSEVAFKVGFNDAG